MLERIALALVLVGLSACATGCRQRFDRAAFISAINKSFAGRHECVWLEAIKLPARVDPSKDERIRDFDALFDAGLLIRASEEKNATLVGSKPIDNSTSPTRVTPPGLPTPAGPVTATSVSGTSTSPPSRRPLPTTPPTPRNTRSITNTRLKASLAGLAPPNR
jgi:hypothetical protein